MAVQLTHEDTYAFAELLELLSLMDEESVSKIPKKLMSLFETHAAKDYTKHLSLDLPLEEQNISEKTISYLGVLCLNYWCDSEEEKEELLFQVRQNDIKKEEELREKYSYEKMFNNQKTEHENTSNNISSESSVKNSNLVTDGSNLPIDYNNLPWFKKVFSKIKNFFNNIFKTKNPT